MDKCKNYGIWKHHSFVHYVRTEINTPIALILIVWNVRKQKSSEIIKEERESVS
jgi:hypothetical protein